MKELILNEIKNKKIAILGFGREGVSTYKFIRAHFPKMPITVADRSEAIVTDEFAKDKYLTVVCGEKYAQGLNDFDMIFKTPGVNLNRLDYFIVPTKIVSQTELFLMAFRKQTVGVTGTKGKSTTSSLIFHILLQSGYPVILAGNIGVPFFDIIEKITPQTTIVAELSAHQLEYTEQSPHIAVFLNMYQEHLDHFNSFSAYQQAKLNITRFQKPEDIFIYNADDVYIPGLLKGHAFERIFLQFGSQSTIATGAYCHDDHLLITDKGEIKGCFDLRNLAGLPGLHNYHNVAAAVLACRALKVDDNRIMTHLQSFKGLEHRIECIGRFDDICFYNDSISTIPEATIAAMNTLKKVDTLILGGFDRGIEYTALVDFLKNNAVANIVFTGPAGQRMMKEWYDIDKSAKTVLFENDYGKIIEFAFTHTQKGKICLLSPAASSYDQFKNFEERGKLFKELVRAYPTQNHDLSIAEK